VFKQGRRQLSEMPKGPTPPLKIEMFPRILRTKNEQVSDV